MIRVVVQEGLLDDEAEESVGMRGASVEVDEELWLLFEDEEDEEEEAVDDTVDPFELLFKGLTIVLLLFP